MDITVAVVMIRYVVAFMKDKTMSRWVRVNGLLRLLVSKMQYCAEHTEIDDTQVKRDPEPPLLSGPRGTEKEMQRSKERQQDTSYSSQSCSDD